MAKRENPRSGTVLESLPNGSYRVQVTSLSGQDLGDNGMVVFTTSRVTCVSAISLINGDKVDIELTPYDLEKVESLIVITSIILYESSPVNKNVIHENDVIVIRWNKSHTKGMSESSIKESTI